MSVPPPGPRGSTEATSRTISSTDGVTLVVHDLGGSGPPVLMCHPTGFHGLVWSPVAARLAEAAHVWALDFRGHGDSTAPASGSYRWAGMADDVLAAVDALELDGPEPLVGAGHSMGGAALMMAELARPGLFAALWCFEPIAVPRLEAPAGSTEEPPVARFSLADSARRRKAWFPDREAAFANYAAKPPLGLMTPDALAAYVSHGFRDLPDGGVELKCAPETEARCFEASLQTDVFARLGEVKCPVTVVASGDGGFPAQIAPQVVEGLADGRLEQLDQLTHFGPMEDPPAVARSVLSTVGARLRSEGREE